MNMVCAMCAALPLLGGIASLCPTPPTRSAAPAAMEQAEGPSKASGNAESRNRRIRRSQASEVEGPIVPLRAQLDVFTVELDREGATRAVQHGTYGALNRQLDEKLANQEARLAWSLGGSITLHQDAEFETHQVVSIKVPTGTVDNPGLLHDRRERVECELRVGVRDVDPEQENRLLVTMVSQAQVVQPVKNPPGEEQGQGIGYVSHKSVFWVRTGEATYFWTFAGLHEDTAGDGTVTGTVFRFSLSEPDESAENVQQAALAE